MDDGRRREEERKRFEAEMERRNETLRQQFAARHQDRPQELEQSQQQGYGEIADRDQNRKNLGYYLDHPDDLKAAVRGENGPNESILSDEFNARALGVSEQERPQGARSGEEERGVIAQEPPSTPEAYQRSLEAQERRMRDQALSWEETSLARAAREREGRGDIEH